MYQIPIRPLTRTDLTFVYKETTLGHILRIEFNAFETCDFGGVFVAPPR